MSSNLPISSRYRTQPDAPVTEEERNQLSTQLNEAFTAGQLDQQGYDELLDRIFGARKLGDLAPVVERLGKPATHNEPAIVQQTPGGRPGELSEARTPSNRASLALVGGVAGGLILIVLIVLLAVLL
ncbi:hypothetical protein CGZ98_13070 [Enemella evansiae]|uniref:DUF1707 SHOCT-like domain-containing protein n=1 Tax=Enemella evansiae TaxID=2016499 RepID=UPI000B9760C5|nr:DUF1707 domain-containing protein [Enemella evansiae]OYO10027.1 hypothetical protein CGZ98_13070 [Enemella evansiae]